MPLISFSILGACANKSCDTLLYTCKTIAVNHATHAVYCSPACCAHHPTRCVLVNTDEWFCGSRGDPHTMLTLITPSGRRAYADLNSDPPRLLCHGCVKQKNK